MKNFRKEQFSMRAFFLRRSVLISLIQLRAAFDKTCRLALMQNRARARVKVLPYLFVNLTDANLFLQRLF